MSEEVDTARDSSGLMAHADMDPSWLLKVWRHGSMLRGLLIQSKVSKSCVRPSVVASASACLKIRELAG